MIPPGSAYRPEFTVRCACGIEYHTSDDHVGKKLPCSCGRTLDVVRPRDTSTRGSNAAGSVSDSSNAGQLFTVDETVHRGKRHREHRVRNADATHGFLAAFAKYRKHRSTRSRGAGQTTAASHSDSASSGRRHRHSAGRTQRAWHTASVWLAAMLRPMFFGSRAERTSAMLAWSYLTAITLSWMALVFTSEHLLPGTILAYGPRFLVLYPLVIIVPLCVLFARATLWPLALGAWIALVPVMGGRVALRTLFAPHLLPVPAAGTFRLLTFNVESGRRLAYDLPVLLHDQRPDIVTFQECGDELWAALQAQKGWSTKRYGGLCTGSRWPIGAVDMMPRADLARISSLGFGGTGLVMRTVLNTPRGALILINLHLETARKGLEGMLGKEGFVPDDPLNTASQKTEDVPRSEPSELQRFEINAIIRTAESERASRYASQGINRVPIVVAGDFNLPVESTIFRDHWRNFTDAFEARGNGLGWSKREGRWLRIRIDHVLTNGVGPHPLHVIVGPDYGSDHLPVIVDLAWPKFSSAQETH